MRLRFVFRRLQFFRIYENLSAEHVSTFLLSAPFPVYGCSLFELSVRQSFRPSTVALFPSRSSALQPLINRSEGREASATGAETTKCLAHTIIIAVVSLCVGRIWWRRALLLRHDSEGDRCSTTINSQRYSLPFFPYLCREGGREGIIMRPQTGSLPPRR